ncbi:MAG: cation:proton antiporter [Candidatus Altiarchaeia archaeon]
MRKTIKKVGHKAKHCSGYVVVGLALLLFFSVIRASIFTNVPEEKRIWFELSFLLLVAVASEYLVVYLKQPNVMVLILMGVLISPGTVSLVSPYVSFIISPVFSLFWSDAQVAGSVPSLVPSGGLVDVFAKLGSIFLLFNVGLHCEVQRIFNKKNFYVAAAGVIVPFLGGYLYASTSGHSFAYSMFLGAALTATSVGVTAAVLEELKVLEKDYARVILGAAVIDDILGLLVLSIVENTPSNLELDTVTPLLMILLTAAVYVIGALRIGQYVVAKYFNDCCTEKGELAHASFLLMLVYVLSYAYVAEYIGLSAIVGAFIAGVTLNYSKSSHKILATVYPLEAFFTPIFFISLGMLVDVNALGASIVPIIAVTLIAVLTKIIGCGLAALTSGSNMRDSMVIGLGMIPRGEVALIIGLYGLTSNVLSPAEYSVIASMAFLSTIIIPALLHRALKGH